MLLQNMKETNSFVTVAESHILVRLRSVHISGKHTGILH